MRPLTFPAALTLAVVLLALKPADAQTRHVLAGDTLRIDDADQLRGVTELAVGGALVLDGSRYGDGLHFAGRIRVAAGGSLFAAQLSLKPADDVPPGALLEVDAHAGTVELRELRVRDHRPGRHAPSVDLRGGFGCLTDAHLSGVGPLLRVSASGFRVLGNRLRGSGNGLVELAPAGLATDIEFRDNVLALVAEGAEACALAVGNPYQRVVDNRVTLSGPGRALAYAPPEGYEGYVWQAGPASEMICRGNVLRQSVQGQGTGLAVSVHVGGEWWSIAGLQASGFAVGAEVYAQRLTLVDAALVGNAVGCRGSGCRLRGGSVDGDGRTGSVGIRVDGPAGRLGFADLALVGLDTAIVLAGPLGDEARLRDLRLQRVGRLVAAHPAASGGEGLRFVGGWPTDHPAPGVAVAGCHAGAEGHAPAGGRAHHHARPPDATVVYLPAAHPLAGHERAGARSDTGWVRVPATQLGTLTIATGRGLSDPVSEHGLGFRELRLARGGEELAPRDQTPQSAHFSLRAGPGYQLRATHDGDAADRSFAWSGSAPLTLELEGGHGDLVFAKSMGAELPDLPDEEALAASVVTAVHRDRRTGRVLLRLVPQADQVEVVCYARRQRARLAGGEVRIEVADSPDGLLVKAVTPREFHGEALTLTVADAMGEPLASRRLAGRRQVEIAHAELLGRPGGWLFVAGPDGSAKAVWSRDTR